MLWGVGRSYLRQWLTSGDLSAHVWLPVMSVYVSTNDGQSKQLQHWEGYCLLSQAVCQRLFSYGEARLREFHCPKTGSCYYMPDTANDIMVAVDDLLILEEERLRFENAHGLSSTIDYPIVNPQLRPTDAGSAFKTIRFDRTFKMVHMNGKDYYFGDMQAAILRLLHQSALEGIPWMNGKQLLRDVGSQSFSLSNVFKHNPIWDQVVISDKRGSYRLAEPFVRLA